MHTPLVFLPGIMCDLRVFGSQLIDLGCERSVTIPPITQGESVEEIASNILNQVPNKFALAGHSLGGVIAMEVLRRAPERVTRIALMNTNSLAATPQIAAEYEPVIIKLRSGQLHEAIAALVPSEHLAPGVERAEILANVSRQPTHKTRSRA